MGKEELLMSDKCTIPATSASPQAEVLTGAPQFFSFPNLNYR